MNTYNIKEPIPVAVRSNVWSLQPVAGSNAAGGHGGLSLVSIVCCQVEVSASG